MTPNRCKTLIGLPCVRELDAEPFELRARMVQLPAPTPRVITQVRLRTRPAPAPAPGLEPLKPAHFVVAILVMAMTAFAMQVML
jgi:hypothetical protein